MRSTKKTYFTAIAIISSCLFLFGLPQVMAFEPHKGDMSTFYPNKQLFPTSGDTIKLGHVEVYSGPGAGSGEIGFCYIGWIVHDINSQGGIFVDGKMKKIQIVKGDTALKPTTAKRAAEKLVLQDKVDVLTGSTGTHIAAVVKTVAKKYKKLYLNFNALSDLLTDGKHFNRYTFRVAGTTTMIGKALAYACAARPERKYYILCQDYAYGHAWGEAFKKALKKYRPEAKIVGEAYHPLMNKDFAPYLTKVQGSGAEVIVTGNYLGDAFNLEKQAKQMGMMDTIKIFGGYVGWPDNLKAMGGGKVGTNIAVVAELPYSWHNPKHKQFLETWNNQWKKWKKPYNTRLYKWASGRLFLSHYWLFDLMQRAKTTNTEKLIELWEGDTFEYMDFKVKMRACDHETAMDLGFSQLGFPNRWQEDVASYEEPFIIPARFALPPIAEDLDRCK